MLKQKPRRSGGIARPNAGNNSTLRRGPRKTYSSTSRTANPQELDELRDKLIDNPDFSGIEMPKLIQLEQNTQEHIQHLIQNKFYNQAKLEQNFLEQLRYEIKQQSGELERYMQKETSRSKTSQVKLTPKAYVFFCFLLLTTKKKIKKIF